MGVIIKCLHTFGYFVYLHLDLNQKWVWPKRNCQHGVWIEPSPISYKLLILSIKGFFWGPAQLVIIFYTDLIFSKHFNWLCFQKYEHTIEHTKGWMNKYNKCIPWTWTFFVLWALRLIAELFVPSHRIPVFYPACPIYIWICVCL